MRVVKLSQGLIIKDATIGTSSILRNTEFSMSKKIKKGPYLHGSESREIIIFKVRDVLELYKATR